jgi:putative ABC transport system permease protein
MAQIKLSSEMGAVEQIREGCRDMRRVNYIEDFFEDLRYSLRQMRRNPGFTAVAVITLALGIGATAAVFTVVDRDLFRDPPYPQSERLVSWGVVAPIEDREFMLGKPYVELHQHTTPFESYTSWTPGVVGCDLTEQNPVRLNCARVESNFLATFRVTPMLGRDFSREDDRPGAPRVALITYGLWQRRFGANPDAVGKTISLDGQPTNIVGVLPPDFEMPTLARVDVLIPQVLDEAAELRSATGRVLRTFARLKPGMTIPRATAELQGLYQEFIASAPAQFRKEIHLSVRSLRDFQVSDVRRALWLLFASGLAVLLIACANVAGLMLARAAGRQQERAIRAALGAGRGRLIRQTLVESLPLGLMGGAAGCLLAAGLVRVFVAIAPTGIPRLDEARLDPRVLVFTLAISFCSAVFFGLVPALQIPRAEALAGRHVLGLDRHRFRQVLVVAQVAASMVLLAGASLLLRSLWKLERAPLGIQGQGVLAVNIDFGQAFYPQPALRLAFFDEVEARLKRLPGVETLALSDSIPPGGWEHSRIYAGIEVSGRPKYTEGTGGMVAWRSVTPGYFSVLNIRILRGRGFQEEDRNPGARVIVLSRTLTQRLFPGQDPVGQQLRLGADEPWLTVVGVADDVKNGGLEHPADPEYYVVRRRTPDDAPPFSTVLIRSSINPDVLAQWVRSEIAALNATLPLKIETMRQRLDSFSARPRFDAALLGMFAALGCLLAAVGLYGVIAFMVAERTQEIGVRMALGASRGEILRLFSSKGLRLIALGSVVGVVCALAASRLITSLLYGVTPNDPPTLVVAVLLLAIVTLAATYIPARRATKVDPMVALRYE